MDCEKFDQHLMEALFEELDESWEEVVVGTRQDRDRDGIDIFLDRRADHLLRSLVKTGVDDLESGITERTGDDLRSSIVAVEAHLADQQPQFSHVAHSDSRRMPAAKRPQSTETSR